MLNNLPLQLTSFVGRKLEMDTVSRLLATTRLLTLIGAGGVGKTRLALQVVAEVLDRFSDGVWLVKFAPLSDPLLVPYAVTSALGIREEAGRSVRTALEDYLQSRQALLVFDNCEHLVVACAALAESLLQACARLSILATSRETLGIGGETVWRVPSLSLPHHGQSPDFHQVRQFEAVQLFCERAAAVKPGFTLTDQNAHAVAQVCSRLDGIPLAIELAARRMNMFSVAELLARLDERFRLLTGGSRTALPRQQTLQATVDWSYALLSAGEQVLLQRLSVFAGTWTLEAAEAVCAEEPAQGGGAGKEVLDALTQLVNKSLVIAEEQDREVRYRLLETIRLYAHKKLVDAGQAEGVRRRHWDWCLHLAKEANPKPWGIEQAAWLNRLEAEHDNLRAALGNSLSAGAGEIAAQLAAALWSFWWTHSHFSEGLRWLDTILANRRSLSESAQSKVLFGAGLLTREQGDFERARALYDQALHLQRKLGDKEGIAETLSYLSQVPALQGDHEQAAKLCEESLTLYRELDNKGGIALALHSRALVAVLRGEYKQAAALSQESITLKRELQDRFSLDYTLYILAFATMLQGDYKRAIQACREALVMSQNLENKIGLAYSLIIMAAIAGAQGQAERAAQLLGAAEALQDAIGAPLPPGVRPFVEFVTMTTRDHLSEATFAERWEQGRAMPLEQALAEAAQTALLGQATPTRPVLSYPAGLSRREVEVLRLLAQGLTNPQIAERLIVSKETVHSHVSTIYSKIGVTTRAAATRYALDHGLDVEDEA